MTGGGWLLQFFYIFFNKQIEVHAIPASRVVFTAKASLDIFSLGSEHVRTCSVPGDCIYEMNTVTNSGQLEIKTLFLLYFHTW